MTPRPVSVILPLSQAIDRVNQLLFRPFDPGKWFTIGFCAWLAFLGEKGGGSGFNFHLPGGGRNSSEEFGHAWQFVVNNLYWIVPVGAAVFVFCIALGVLITWLNSRGKFMFLHCVALNQADVAAPWKKFAREANSLFWFRIVLGLIGAAVMIPPAIMVVVVIVEMARRGWNPGGILALLGIGLVMVAIGIVLAVIRKLTMDFVVPVMFLRGKSCLECWREFGRLLTARFGHFVLYLLFQILITLVIGAGVLMIVLGTCCIAGCLLAIPYLGTVLLLPVLVFTRSYSLCYLAQYGPEYDVFSPAAPPA